MFNEMPAKAIGVTANLTTENPVHICRLGSGTTITFQHDIPEGYVVKVYGTVSSHREIPDSTDGRAVDASRIEMMRNKGILAEFSEFETLSGHKLTSVYGLALNGLKFELVALNSANAKNNKPDTDTNALPTEAVSPTEMDWNALRNLAKSLGLTASPGKKREELEEEVSKALAAIAGGDENPEPAKNLSVQAADRVQAKVAFTVK